MVAQAFFTTWGTHRWYCLDLPSQRAKSKGILAF